MFHKTAPLRFQQGSRYLAVKHWQKPVTLRPKKDSCSSGHPRWHLGIRIMNSFRSLRHWKLKCMKSISESPLIMSFSLIWCYSWFTWNERPHIYLKRKFLLIRCRYVLHPAPCTTEDKEVSPHRKSASITLYQIPNAECSKPTWRAFVAFGFKLVLQN